MVCKQSERNYSLNKRPSGGTQGLLENDSHSGIRISLQLFEKRMNKTPE
jgi:hypothetical protein